VNNKDCLDFFLRKNKSLLVVKQSKPKKKDGLVKSLLKKSSYVIGALAVSYIAYENLMNFYQI
jgi:hypothetical protein